MKKLTLALGIMLSMASSVFAQIGNAAADLVYTPVTPCRILDTRPSQGGSGPIAAGGSKNFQIWGAASYATQGGTASDCGLTAGNNVAAVAMNFTVVTPTAGGFITAYPFGAALPTAATVNFQAGDIARGDFTIVKVAQTGTNHLSIFSASNADVVGDVVGFYSKPAATALECESLIGSTIVPANGTGSAAKACSAGFTMTGGGCDHNGADTALLVAKTQTSENGWFCRWQNTTAVDTIGSVRARCCRLPGR